MNKYWSYCLIQDTVRYKKIQEIFELSYAYLFVKP